MSVLINTLREILAAIRQQTLVNRELTAELRVFNRTMVPRLSKIESIQEARKNNHIIQDQISAEMDEYLADDF
ncbi:hypothetical protein KKI24_10920 [bacterium]|nr:hypothetical protein [bacterium]